MRGDCRRAVYPGAQTTIYVDYSESPEFTDVIVDWPELNFGGTIPRSSGNDDRQAQEWSAQIPTPDIEPARYTFNVRLAEGGTVGDPCRGLITLELP